MLTSPIDRSSLKAQHRVRPTAGVHRGQPLPGRSALPPHSPAGGSGSPSKPLPPALGDTHIFQCLDFIRFINEAGKRPTPGGRGRGLDALASPSAFGTHPQHQQSGPAQRTTYPAPVEDGGRLEDPSGHVCHLVFHHDSKFTNVWICIETGTSHLEREERRGSGSGGDLCFLPEAVGKYLTPISR